MVCTCAAHYTSVQQRIPMGDFDKALCNSNFRNIFAFAWVAEDIYIPTWLTDKWRLGQKVMKTRSLLEFSRYKYKILGYPSYMQTDTCTCT